MNNAQVQQHEEVLEIRTIYGRLSSVGDSKNSCERYAQEARAAPFTNVHHLNQHPNKSSKRECEYIIFTKFDARWVHHPDHDA